METELERLTPLQRAQLLACRPELRKESKPKPQEFYRTLQTCPRCHGSGKLFAGSYSIQCSNCLGLGSEAKILIY